jgi:hypothetical protein
MTITDTYTKKLTPPADGLGAHDRRRHAESANTHARRLCAQVLLVPLVVRREARKEIPDNLAALKARLEARKQYAVGWGNQYVRLHPTGAVSV